LGGGALHSIPARSGGVDLPGWFPTVVPVVHHVSTLDFPVASPAIPRHVGPHSAV